MIRQWFLKKPIGSKTDYLLKIICKEAQTCVFRVRLILLVSFWATALIEGSRFARKFSILRKNSCKKGTNQSRWAWVLALSHWFFEQMSKKAWTICATVEVTKDVTAPRCKLIVSSTSPLLLCPWLRSWEPPIDPDLFHVVRFYNRKNVNNVWQNKSQTWNDTQRSPKVWWHCQLIQKET